MFGSEKGICCSFCGEYVKKGDNAYILNMAVMIVSPVSAKLETLETGVQVMCMGCSSDLHKSKKR